MNHCKIDLQSQMEIYWMLAAKSLILRCYNQFQDPVGTEVIIFRNEEGFRGSGMCSLHQDCFNKCYLRQSKRITSKTRGWGWCDLATLNEWFIKAYRNKKQHTPVLKLSSEVRSTCSAAQQLTCPSLNLHLRWRQDNLNLLRANPHITFKTFWARQPLQMSDASHRSRTLTPTPGFGPEIQLKDIVLLSL